MILELENQKSRTGNSYDCPIPTALFVKVKQSLRSETFWYILNAKIKTQMDITSFKLTKKQLKKKEKSSVFQGEDSYTNRGTLCQSEIDIIERESFLVWKLTFISYPHIPTEWSMGNDS
jgi:hypothetical protein